MKALLASLICYVLFASQCFAIKGGPPYPGGTINTVGTYAAILVPKGSFNTLGLFTLVVPSTGLATGSAYMFGFGAALTGTVQGAVDPRSGSLYAVFNTEIDITVATSSDTTLVYAYLANGQLSENKIVPGNGFNAPRISGDAKITFTASEGASQYLPGFPSNKTIDYTILGFKQA